MLQPDDRHPLQELLRPPDGYSLDLALGTTFSLDLAALLSVPLSFSLMDMEDDEDQSTSDSIALLESLRRYANRTAIFCQSGRIAAPAKVQRLFSYLEGSVCEVVAPSQNGVFHPKVWVLKFIGNTDESVRYRVLCASRNLTFDRSWDTVICLEGSLKDRTRAYATNHPLGDFVKALPGLARQEVTPHVRSIAETIQDEIRRVEFEVPEPASEIRFWPIGIDGYMNKWPFTEQVNRMLVVSPFLAEGFLGRIEDTAEEKLLVSRLESLSTLPPASLAGLSKIYFLQPDLHFEDAVQGSQRLDDTPLEGLHAKIYLTESGWNARFLSGSANATNAAFKANVEFMVELKGYKSQMGIDKLLAGGSDDFGLLNLLQEFKPGSSATVEVDALQKQLETLLNECRNNLTRMAISAEVSQGEEPHLYRIVLNSSSTSARLPEGVMGRCWPVNLAEAQGMPMSFDSGPIAVFSKVTFEAITSFFAVELTATLSGRRHSLRFAINLPLVLPPDNSLADRNDRLLRSFLKDTTSVARYLYFLLNEDSAEARAAAGRATNGFSTGGSSTFIGARDHLFESLLHTLGTNPSKLEHVQAVLTSLRQNPESAALIPPGFEEIWEPIWQARQELQQ